MTLQVWLASSNPGKAREAEAILAGGPLEVVRVPMWLGEVETGESYLENARMKAAALMRMTGRPVLAEDSGLEVDALEGRPGIRSARFAGPAATSAANNGRLLRLMDSVTNRNARYRAVAVLMFPSGGEISSEGVVEGRILTAPRGEGGFGYDPLFVPLGYEASMAELPLEEKNRISHRARALQAIVEAIRTEGR